MYYFTKEHIGILSRMMKILLSERIHYKNLSKKASGADSINMTNDNTLLKYKQIPFMDVSVQVH